MVSHFIQAAMSYRFRLINENSDPFFGNQFREIFKRTIVCFFCVFREKASRHLSFLQVVGYAVTADTLMNAWFVRAAESFEIIFLFAFHGIYPFASPHHDRLRDGGMRYRCYTSVSSIRSNRCPSKTVRISMLFPLIL